MLQKPNHAEPWRLSEVFGFCPVSNGVTGGFSKGGAGSNGCGKTKHSFLRISNIVGDVEAELPFGQMEPALTTAPQLRTRGGEPGRTQHPLIRVDIGWGGRAPQPIIAGSWGRWGGNGKARGCRGWWWLGGRPGNWAGRPPTLALPVSLSQALSLLAPHPHSVSGLLLLSLSLYTPASSPSPSLSSQLPEEARSSPFLNFLVFSAHKILHQKIR